jgi:hypothetical protein
MSSVADVELAERYVAKKHRERETDRNKRLQHNDL